ncbi:Kinesin light chain [Colletotrichum fructicola]|nr:Kinesin light chain [Colletotrichum fructicola]KAF4929013.1 Kinesin light chain [Colletotrichum fructicola]
MAQKWRHDDYKVAWICPLEVEQIAALEMLDDEHPALPKSPADHNVYSLGSINGHNIVIAGLYEPGNCPAATVVAQMRMTFPSLRYGLLVGIGGGVPVETDNGIIRLGHVVVSKPTAGHSGALQYDHGKARDGQFQRIGALAPPPAVLLNAAQDLEAKRARLDIDPVQQNVSRINTRRRGLRRFQYPGMMNDYLYPPQYAHTTQGEPCTVVCDPLKRISRASDDDETYVIVHSGNIASGELVVKDARLRDALAQQHELLCFEMEGAGAIADFPCLIVRGISDYCDSHKNDKWHGYAAAAAAAPPINSTHTFKLQGVNSVNNFVARQAELGRLHEALKWTGNRRTVVVHGLGGMGKTQTTIAYAKQHRHDYSAVIWFDASNETALRQSYQRAAQRIASGNASVMYVQNAVNSRDLDETVAAVKRWLEDPKNNRWLLVHDNYDDVEFRTQDSSKQTTRCVVTDTESNVRGTVSKTYDIRPYFPETEHGAISITTRSSSVGRLGQSIQLEKLCDIQESIEILASTSGRVDFSKDPGSKLLAQKLDGLPLALATAGAYLNKVSTSSTEYIQMYEISWLQLQEQSPHLLEYDRALYSTWNVSLRHIQLQNQYAVKLLRLWGHFDNYDLWQRYDAFYHAFRMTATLSAAKIEGDLKVSPLVFHRFGRLYLVQRRFTEANSMMEQFLRGLEKLCQDHILPLSDAVSLLGRLYLAQDRLDDAEAMFKRALHIREKTSSLDHIGIVAEHHLLRVVYFKRGQLEDAEGLCEQMIEIHEKAQEPDYLSTTSMASDLGSLFIKQGRLEYAETLLRLALQGYEKAVGLDDPDTLRIVCDLGIFYTKRGQLEEAMTMCERAFEGYKKAFGPDHPDTLRLSAVWALSTMKEAS